MTPALLDAYLPVAVLLGFTFVLAGVYAGANAEEIGRGEDVSHLWEGRERAAALGGYVALAFVRDIAEARWAVFGFSIVLGAGAVLCLFGLRFDIRLNLRRALNRFYVGTDSQTAASDQAVTRAGLSGKAYAMLKLLGVVACSAALVWVRWPK